MNTEPPTGDDLQQMLVAMKRNVLEHADERRPSRRRHRPGIIVAAVALLALGTASGAVALAVVPQHQTAAPSASAAPRTPTPTVTSSSAPVVETPAPRSSAPSATAAVRYPTDCRALYTAADRDRFFSTTPVTQRPEHPDGTTTPAPAPVRYLNDTWTASTWLDCQWGPPGADATGIRVAIGSASDDQISHRRDLLRAESGTCRTEDLREVCTRVIPGGLYPVDTTETFWAQDGRWIDISQSNMPTSGLLQATIDGLRASASGADGPGTWQITGAAVGPITFGRPLSAALGDVQGLYDQEPIGDPCRPQDITSLQRAGLSELTVLNRGGAVVAVLLQRPAETGSVTAADLDQNPRTPEGTGIGSTLAELRQTYPDLTLSGSHAMDGSTAGPSSYWTIARNGRYISFGLDDTGARVAQVWVAETKVPEVELC